MRHNKKFNHLSRTAAHRKAMLSNMANSLITHKRIYTTLPKAKALRVYVEPIITKSKEDTVHARRVAYSKLQNHDTVKELFTVVSAKVANRPGGYTRILKTGRRQGDDAMMCFIELVDFNENRVKEDKKSTSGKRTRRSRRSSKQTETANAAEATTLNETAPIKDEAPIATEE